MCLLNETCPLKKDRSYSFCTHPGYSLKEVEEILGVKQSTLRRNRLYIINFEGRHYVPRCSFISYKRQDRLNSENIPIDEWRDFVRLKAIGKINSMIDVDLDYVEAEIEYLLHDGTQEQIAKIVFNTRERLKNIRDKLLNRINIANDNELREMICLMSESQYIRAKDIADRDADYRALAPTLAYCNIGYTRKEQIKYNTRNPIRHLWDNLRKHYRNGLNWQRKREKLIKERGGKCEVCNSKENLHIHHLDGRFINDDECLEVLCQKCHYERHRKEGRNFSS